MAALIVKKLYVENWCIVYANMNYIELIKNNEAYRQDLLTRLIYHSNKIEGTTLTLGETDAILWEKDVPVKATPREFFDVLNHKKAVNFLLETIEEPLSLSVIKNIGIIINENINEIEGFRKVPVVIRGAKDVPPKPEHVMGLLMKTLEQYAYFLDNKVLPSEQREAWLHLHFEHIHPFIDGNGRTGRLLMLRGVLKDNKPPFVIDSEIRTKYIDIVNANSQDELSSLIAESCAREADRIKQTVVS